MKKTLTLLITLCILTTLSYAQDDCKMCGDWVGVYTGTKIHPTEDRLIPADYKLYVRISIIENNISIRLKYQIVDNSFAAVYMNEWTVSDHSEDRIFLMLDSGNDDNEGGGWGLKNGKYCAYRRDVIHASLELKNGILFFYGGTNYITWYDKNGNVIDTSHHDAIYPTRKVTLFKGGDDW